MTSEQAVARDGLQPRENGGVGCPGVPSPDDGGLGVPRDNRCCRAFAVVTRHGVFSRPTAVPRFDGGRLPAERAPNQDFDRTL